MSSFFGGGEQKEAPVDKVKPLDINKLAPLYGSFNPRASYKPEYINQNTRGRDFYGRLSFNTGVLWLTGFIGGGVHGVWKGWSTAVSPNFRIRINNVLNAVSRGGSAGGSTLGVIAFLHTSGVWVADNLELESRTNTAAITPFFAGAATGAIFKSMQGPRAMVLAGVIGSGISLGYWYASSYITDVVLRKGGKY